MEFSEYKKSINKFVKENPQGLKLRPIRIILNESDELIEKLYRASKQDLEKTIDFISVLGPQIFELSGDYWGRIEAGKIIASQAQVLLDLLNEDFSRPLIAFDLLMNDTQEPDFKAELESKLLKLINFQKRINHIDSPTDRAQYIGRGQSSPKKKHLLTMVALQSKLSFGKIKPELIESISHSPHIIKYFGRSLLSDKVGPRLSKSLKD